MLISDNASPDATADLVSRYQAQGITLRYIRSEDNIGADRNILQCFEQARGKYVWICGDDDVIEPTGLDRVVAHLDSEWDYDLVFLQARGFRGTYAPQVPKLPERSKIFVRAEDLARHVNVFFSFISGTIINKNRVLSLPHRPFADLAGTSLLQLGWTYTALEHHRRSLLIHTPLIATLAGNTGGYSLVRVFGTNLKRITEEWITSAQVKNGIYRGTLVGFFPWFLVKSKSSSRFLADDPERILRHEFGTYIHYWVFDYPILKLPRVLGTMWFFLVRIVNRSG